MGENRWGEQRMEAYEFYWLDPKGGYQIIGVLPERRKNSARVTQESIMRRGKKFLVTTSIPKISSLFK